MRGDVRRPGGPLVLGLLPGGAHHQPRGGGAARHREAHLRLRGRRRGRGRGARRNYRTICGGSHSRPQVRTAVGVWHWFKVMMS